MQPYSSSMNRMSGVYRVQIGDVFYIGSTSTLGSRLSSHRGMLLANEHPNALLQAAWDSVGAMSAALLLSVPRKGDDSDTDHRKRLEFHEQLELDRWFGHRGCVNVSSKAGFNSTIGDWLRQKWQEPAFRESQVARLRAYRPSPEVREKLSKAKRGARNLRSRAVSLHLGGKAFRFPCASDAARHFGVSQQVMDLWLRGKLAWPGSGPRKPRAATVHLIGLTGSYVD